MEVLQIIWFILIGVLLLGYSILDGFDLGIGVLFPFLAKNDNEKRVLLNAIAPFWDGNEVWLLTGAGALFAAFSNVYATVFSGFYLALMIVLFSLILRAVSMEFRAQTDNKKLWERVFVISSFLPSLLYGVALGNIIVGVPLNAQMEFTGNFFTLLRPFPLSLGLLGLSAILLQGSTYSALKSEGELNNRARELTKVISLIFIGLFLLALVLTFVCMPDAVSKPVAWIFGIITIIFVWFTKLNAKNGDDFKSFIFASLSFAGLWSLAGSVMFPNMLKASNNSTLSLTIWNASSSKLTLTVMLIIALIGMPIVLAYTYMIYRWFRGKVVLEDVE